MTDMTVPKPTLDNVRTYLTAHGWTLQVGTQPSIDRWLHPLYGDYPRYGIRIQHDDEDPASGLLELLADHEGRCEHEVLADMLGEMDVATVLARIAELEEEREQLVAQARLDLRAVTTFLVATERADLYPPKPFDPNDRRGRAQFHLRNHFIDRIKVAVHVDPSIADREVVIGAGSPETSALTHCPTCGAPEWHPDGRRGWNPVDVECEDCAGTYGSKGDE